MIFLFITTISLLGASIYAGFRVWYLAGSLADAQEYIEELEVTNRYMYSKILSAHDAMQQIDRLGAFEKDDEAGTTFQLLTEVITELKETFDGEAQEEK
jgi:hypothetical protein